MPDKKTVDIGWEPAPGYVLIKPIDREELQRKLPGTSSLEMPDDVQKVSDHTGVGEVIKCGSPTVEALLEARKLSHGVDGGANEKIAEKALPTTSATPGMPGAIKPGDLIAFMPYTDKILEINMQKYALVGYKQIMGVLKKAL